MSSLSQQILCQSMKLDSCDQVTGTISRPRSTENGGFGRNSQSDSHLIGITDKVWNSEPDLLNTKVPVTKGPGSELSESGAPSGSKEQPDVAKKEKLAAHFVDSLFGKLDIDESDTLSKDELLSASESDQFSPAEKRLAAWSAANIDVLRHGNGPVPLWKHLIDSEPRPIGDPLELFWRQGIDRKSLTLAAQPDSEDAYKSFRDNYIRSQEAPTNFLLGVGLSAYSTVAMKYAPQLVPQLKYPKLVAFGVGVLAVGGISAYLKSRAETHFDNNVAPDFQKMQMQLKSLKLPLE
jgi:hypothetical protein